MFWNYREGSVIIISCTFAIQWRAHARLSRGGGLCKSQRLEGHVKLKVSFLPPLSYLNFFLEILTNR